MSSHGFDLLREERVEELQATARLYRHTATGAEFLSISAPDENKVFGITFRTPPADHTGVAHILEHSVLCGSRKYPTKEPFVELLKGSLQTFLNAFTYPDKTCYPVASQNLQDFYNLADVYLDAVFHPLLTRQTYEQEAWHLELESADAAPAFKGVVFNEMKGFYSSPDSTLIEHSQRSLFPDTTYGVDSGGDPEHIPDLTFEQLRGFHERFYHPSNARIFMYGDDNLDRRLEFLGGWLAPFARRQVDSSIAMQPPFSAPRAVRMGYRVDHATGSEKSFVTVNWLAAPAANAGDTLALTILAHILIGTQASPLRRALLDSGLGEDLIGAGFENHAQQTFFSTGLRGVAQGDVGKVQPLVLDTLGRLAGEGIDPRTVEASLNTIEFALRENNSGSYPRGLVVMLRALTTWLYGGDPIAPLRFADAFASIRARLSAGERVFEDLLKRWLVENPHRTTVILDPDPALGTQVEQREQARLAALRAAMSDAEVAASVARTHELKRLQGAPDDPEALARIPRLTLKDLDRDIKRLPIDRITRNQARVIHHDVATNGILYLDLGLNLRTLPAELISYAPVLGRALLETGTAKEDHVALAQRIGAKTGGIRPQSYTALVRETETGACWLFLRGKAMADRAGELIDILRDVLASPRIDLQTRVRQIVLEEKAGIEGDLVPTGHVFVGNRLRAGFTESDWASEHLRGVSYLQFLRRLLQDIDTDWENVESTLRRVLEILLNRRTMILNATVDAASWSKIEPLVFSLAGDIPARPSKPETWPAPRSSDAEGLAIPSQVNYVGKALDLRRSGHTITGHALVAIRFLRTAYLWEKVRVQGGAYGGFCHGDPRAGIVSFVSYRDPNLAATLDIYDAAAAYLEALDLTKDELAKAIIGTIGDLDQPLLPDAKGYVSLMRWLSNEPDDFRQQVRDQVLKTKLEDLRAFGAALRDSRERSHVVVLGDHAALEKHGVLAVTKIL